MPLLRLGDNVARRGRRGQYFMPRACPREREHELMDRGVKNKEVSPAAYRDGSTAARAVSLDSSLREVRPYA